MSRIGQHGMTTHPVARERSRERTTFQVGRVARVLTAATDISHSHVVPSENTLGLFIHDERGGSVRGRRPYRLERALVCIHSTQSIYASRLKSLPESGVRSSGSLCVRCVLKVNKGRSTIGALSRHNYCCTTFITEIYKLERALGLPMGYEREHVKVSRAALYPYLVFLIGLYFISTPSSLLLTTL
ncbi:uncharacterized protein LOC112452751 isoform X1 [Temnothorax curvispinosus]|uniref:Uncharacterized protein LOC112452751 isoform X1 n=1 Tax=Temnothorax curvispinosus TaxID=300111 RepID=A0A6J1PH76_9HYME|nr:uncharacterized protein LOC112452751 isoform X1 [Temnothorax curvispinosus]